MRRCLAVFFPGPLYQNADSCQLIRPIRRHHVAVSRSSTLATLEMIHRHRASVVWSRRDEPHRAAYGGPEGDRCELSSLKHGAHGRAMHTWCKQAWIDGRWGRSSRSTGYRGPGVPIIADEWVGHPGGGARCRREMRVLDPTPTRTAVGRWARCSAINRSQP